MVRAFVGGLSLEIPEGWNDHSMMTLIGPPIQGPTLVRPKQPSEDRPSIVVKREVLAGPTPSLETFASAQESMMANLIPGTKVDGACEVAIGSDSIRGVTREFVIPNPSGELRQIQIYFFVDNGFFVFAGTGPNDLRFDVARRAFMKVIAGIRVETHG
jgi:hypothetical protein